jgi:hypothetical protein
MKTFVFVNLASPPDWCAIEMKSTLTGVSIYMQKFMFVFRREGSGEKWGSKHVSFSPGGFCWLEPLHFLAKNIDIAKGNLKIIPKKKHGTSK